MAYDKMHLSVGSVRCANERRQYGGLLMVTGLCAVFAPIGRIVSEIDTGGLSGDVTDPSTIPFWSFVGGCCMMAIGVSAVLTGFAECVHDAGNTRVTFWAIILTQVRNFHPMRDLDLEGLHKQSLTMSFSLRRLHLFST